jgi:hypothetical protein
MPSELAKKILDNEGWMYLGVLMASINKLSCASSTYLAHRSALVMRHTG